MTPNDKLYQYLTPPKKYNRLKSNGFSSTAPKRWFYCPACKVGFERATKQKPVFHSKSCRTEALVMGTGSEGERKAFELQRNYSAAQREK